MILVDAIYINSFGGKVILELILKELIKSKVSFHIFFDSRISSKYLDIINQSNYTVVAASHKSRIFFYKKYTNKFSSILCLSNIPPPIFSSVNTSIFFHNGLLLNPLTNKVSLKNRIVNFFKFSYLKYYNKNDYNWIVQTPLMNQILRKSLNINSEKIYTFSIFKEVFKKNLTKKITNNFVYVSSGVSHKNHMRLIEAFICAANKTDKKIKLHLTLNKEELPKHVLPKKFKVKFHGTLSEEGINELYNINEFAIYPSLVESFGLPLIEATNHGCKVVASNLPYVHEIIKPSLTFDPYSVESISDSILKAMETDNLPETKVLVENKLDNFIDFIISQDVQK
jgi:glycosyltransferase involved in cell wall biosynthesis